MNIKEFFQKYPEGGYVKVIDTKFMDDAIIDNGMIVYLIKGNDLHNPGTPDEYFDIHFKFDEFLDYNEKLQVPSYYDKNRNPTLRSSEAIPEEWKAGKESWYISSDQSFEEMFELLKPEEVERYRNKKPEITSDIIFEFLKDNLFYTRVELTSTNRLTATLNKGDLVLRNPNTNEVHTIEFDPKE